jgi:hypothetical protein
MAVLLPLFSKKRIVVKKSLENRPTAHVKQHTQLVRRQCTVFFTRNCGGNLNKNFTQDIIYTDVAFARNCVDHPYAKQQGWYQG